MVPYAAKHAPGKKRCVEDGGQQDRNPAGAHAKGWNAGATRSEPSGAASDECADPTWIATDKEFK
jgi:hypothetical protein